MNFSNRLELILELFDIAHSKDALMGVSRSDKKFGSSHYTMYTFQDKSIVEEPIYNVIIKKHDLEVYDFEGRDIKTAITKLLSVNIPGVLTDAVYNIDLTVESLDPALTYNTTGFGNQNFVYGKMFACINDYFTEHGIPAVVKIVPAERPMALVYDRFLKMIGKMKGFNYQVIFPNHYALDKVIDASHIDKKFLNKMKNIKDEELRYIRTLKNQKRTTRYG